MRGDRPRCRVTYPFLDAMPASLRRQKALLHKLIDVLGADPRWRTLELGCSLARGTGDELSDVDCGALAADAAWPGILSTVESVVHRLGDVVDLMHEWLSEHSHHTFVQYLDGIQLSFMASPVCRCAGLAPQTVALIDKDGLLARSWTPGSYTATAADVGRWTFLGWIALADLAKCLRRGSVWEAHARLEEARGHLLRVWGAGHGVAYPAFGLTSVLDAAAVGLPEGLESTVAGLQPADLLRAAHACATSLTRWGISIAMGDDVTAGLRRITA